jgi:D-galactarolactone cycloisomerase
MIITSVETYPLYYRLPVPYGDANGYKRYRSLFLIRIQTAYGLSGWGECSDWLPTLHIGFRDRIIPFLLGRTILDRSLIEKTVAKWHRRAAAAVSMALADLAAKAADISLCEYWGGRQRTEIPLYASFQSYREAHNWQESSLHDVEKRVLAGFNRIKIKIGGRSTAEDQQHVRMIQDYFGPNIRIALDANQSYLPPAVLEWAKMMDSYANWMWLEEPLSLKQTEDYVRLKNTLAVPLSGGENIRETSGYLPWLTNRALDYLHPDPAHLGSIEAYRNTLQLARVFGMAVSPHCFDGPLSRIFAVMAQACLPPCGKADFGPIEPVEWDAMDNPLNDIFVLQRRGGMCQVPEKPGIGVEPDMDRIRFYSWDGAVYS